MEFGNLLIKNVFSYYILDFLQIKKEVYQHTSFGGSPGNRTPDNMIKSHVLYQLS